MNRREFITTGAAAGAFFIAGANRLFGADAPSNRLRFALVGCQAKGRGFSVMQQILRCQGLDIAVICDVDSRAMEAAADWLTKNGYPTPRKEKDFRKVLEMDDIDGIISETPDHFHAWSAVMAMRAGKHVWVEKPCAYCPGELEIIMDTWKKTGTVFQMGSQRRSLAATNAAIEAVKNEGAIGNPRWAKCWYMTDRTGIGVGRQVEVPKWLDWDLWQACAPRERFRDNIVHYNWHWMTSWGTGESGNNSVHFCDIARWCLGADEFPSEITAGGGRVFVPENDDFQFPDTLHSTFRWADGRYLTWEGSSVAYAKPFMGVSSGAMVYGDKGIMYFDAYNNVTLFDFKGNELKKFEEPVRKQTGAGQSRTGGGESDPTPRHFNNFMAAIRANDPLMARSNAEVGTKSTYLALTANVAQRTGGALKIDVRTGRPVGNAAASALWNREYEKGWELV